MSMLSDSRLGVVELVEREHAVAALQAALEDARKGRGRIALLTAEAGGGKTALINRLCTDSRRSVRVLRGACDALFTPRPLGPIRDLAADTTPALQDCLRGETIPYQVAAALIEELTASGPTILVLEDVHWADEASLDVIRLLSRRLENLHVLVILSYRDNELGVSHPLRVMLGEVAATRVELAPLSPAAVAAIADAHD